MNLAEGKPRALEADGGDGAAGLRPVRLRLQDLFRRDLRRQGSPAQSLRARRQGHHADGEGAGRADRQRPRRCDAGRGASPATLATPLAAPGTSRDHPATATLLSCRKLNKPGSEKETWHVEFDLSASGIDYAVGDSFGVFPTNDPALVDAVIKALGAPADFPIGGRTLARGAARRRVAVAGAGHAVSAVLLHHRRRAAKTRPRAGERRGSRMATRRRSTCWRRSRNSPAFGPTRKPSSKRSIRCSRGCIRSRRRRRRRRAGCR